MNPFILGVRFFVLLIILTSFSNVLVQCGFWSGSSSQNKTESVQISINGNGNGTTTTTTSTTDGGTGRNFFASGLSKLLGTVGGTVISTVNTLGQGLENIDDRIGLGGYGLLGMLGHTITRLSDVLGGGVRFYLYTLKNKFGEEISAKGLDSTSWDKTKNTTVIIHGFSPTGYLASPAENLVSMIKIKDGLLGINSTDNIIIVDWTSISSDGLYILAATSTATVADRTTSLLVAMVGNGDIPSPKHIRLIGHSLGGQTCGLIGRNYEDRTKKKIAKIIGLDPAGPEFDVMSMESANVERFRPKQLYKEYADFVQVIHCDQSFLGSHINRGHIDFWPNGGDDMPGCTGDDVQIKHVCSHSKCIDLLVDTFYHDDKIGCKCESYKKYNDGECTCGPEDLVKMGLSCPTTASGVYYMNVTIVGNYDKSTKDPNSKDIVKVVVEEAKATSTTPAPSTTAAAE